jgi:hypothetical protein
MTKRSNNLGRNWFEDLHLHLHLHFTIGGRDAGAEYTNFPAITDRNITCMRMEAKIVMLLIQGSLRRDQPLSLIGFRQEMKNFCMFLGWAVCSYQLAQFPYFINIVICHK